MASPCVSETTVSLLHEGGTPGVTACVLGSRPRTLPYQLCDLASQVVSVKGKKCPVHSECCVCQCL